MGYEIQISEVGVAEYPLMAVLRDTIFAECGHTALTSLEADLEGRSDVHAVIAHLEGNPLGYKVGYRFGPGVYFSKSGGVLKEYRRQGIARRMQQMQHEFARSRGYQTVFFTTFNRFKPMMQFGLRSGFLPVGVEQSRAGDLEIKFAKDLLREEAPGNAQPTLALGEVHVESVGPDLHGLVADLVSNAGQAVSKKEIDREQAGMPDALSVAAFAGGKPVGAATGAAIDGTQRIWRCHRLGVAAAWRGRGVERALLNYLAQAVAGMGYAAIFQNAAAADAPTLLAAIDSGYEFAGMMHAGQADRPNFMLQRAIG